MDSENNNYSFWNFMRPYGDAYQKALKSGLDNEQKEEDDYHKALEDHSYNQDNLPIMIGINVEDEHIQVHVKYPPKYSQEDKKLADYLELELKAAFGRYYKGRDAKAIDIESKEI